jgi:hypothetical protein
MEWMICRDCAGRGSHVTGSERSDKNPHMIYPTFSQCPLCGGTGQLIPCADCERPVRQAYLLPSRFGMVGRCHECHLIARDRQIQEARERDHLDQF